MSNRPIAVLNDDGCGQFGAWKPPVIQADLYDMVDKAAGTGVTTFSVTLYDGHMVWHDSRVCAGDHIVDRSDVPQDGMSGYRILSVCQSLRDQGIDPMRVFVDRAHQQGMKCYVCLRMNDGHFCYSPQGPFDNTYAGRFWREHQDLLQTGEPGWVQHLYDYAKEGTRAYRFAQIEEVCQNYDVDGFELDFMRTPYYFKAAEARSNAPYMTDLVQQVRRMMDDAGRAKGNDLQLLVTVPRTIDECRQIGLDVRNWVSSALVNAIAAKNFIYFEQDLPVNRWAELVAGSGVSFLAGFEHGDTIETFRAAAAKYFRDGADGLYFYNFWSFGLPYNPLGRQILTQVVDPAMLHGQDKHYALLGGGPCAVIHQEDPQPPRTQVPAQLSPGESKPFQIDIADDPAADLVAGTLGDVTLRVVSDGTSTDLQFALNDQAVEPSLWRVHDNTWQAVLTQPRMLRCGVNTLTVTNGAPAAQTITSVELLVHYKDSVPPASQPAMQGGKPTDRDTRYPQEEGPWKTLACDCPSVPIQLTVGQWVTASVNIPEPDTLASAKFVRFEFRTPQDNTRNYKWYKLYGDQPWETDRYEFTVNGRAVPQWQFIQRNSSMKERDYWMWGLRFDVPADWVEPGDNVVQLCLAQRDPMIAWGCTFVHVDLFRS